VHSDYDEEEDEDSEFGSMPKLISQDLGAAELMKNRVMFREYNSNHDE